MRLEKRFLNQQEIIEEHQKHGVFLVPTRMDTQGVSRGEAMSSGLVAITNNVAAIPEFCSNDDSIIIDADDYIGLAESIKNIFANTELFSQLSLQSSKRVHEQCSYGQTIGNEINLINRKESL